MYSFLIRTAAVCVVLLTLPAQAKSFAEAFPELTDLNESKEKTFLQELTYQDGKITLPGGFAELTVPESFYYLGPDDASRVLTEAWGNPPPDTKPAGMLFPAGITPFHSGSWGVEITWDPIGYVSDKDASETDYDALLQTMKADTKANNKWRREHGYEAIHLIGWAAPPYYDAKTRKLHWAKELQFGNADTPHTLNYNMRVLGRKGVLVMNFIADMEQLPEVEAALPAVLATASFTDGSRYEDFNPDIDTVAAVGIGGLIAGKVLTKAGLLAGALLLLKKGWFVIILLLGGLGRLVGRRS